MHENSFFPIIQWWMGKNLPKEHIFIKPEARPKGGVNIARIYFRKWLVHPIKRRVARYYLITLKTLFGLKVVAITGSAGKTTTKEIIASILKLNGETIYSFANIDPVYNIPTTVLKCHLSTKYLVLEMGVEFPGEMDFYLWLAKPDIGVITNIYPTHLQYFKNVNGVFREKSKLVKNLSSNKVAVLNRTDKYLERLDGMLKAKIVWFGEEDSGIENNQLAARAVGEVLGITEEFIEKGIKRYQSQEHRLQIFKHKSGALIIDDSYNNNPMAARAAIREFIKISGKRNKVVVFGDMLELGEFETKYHREVLTYISGLGIKLICVGPASKDKVKGEKWAKDWHEAVPLVLPFLSKNTAILVKGSRSIGLDNLVQAIMK